MTDKNYRKALFPVLGSKKILYPICIIVYWSKLVFTGLFKKNYPLSIGKELRKQYENGKIKNLEEFEEVLQNVLHSS